MWKNQIYRLHRVTTEDKAINILLFNLWMCKELSTTLPLKQTPKKQKKMKTNKKSTQEPNKKEFYLKKIDPRQDKGSFKVLI